MRLIYGFLTGLGLVSGAQGVMSLDKVKYSPVGDLMLLGSEPECPPW
jgi:hypothetical protein